MNIGIIVVAGLGGATAMVAMLVGDQGLTRAFFLGYAGGGFVIAVILSLVAFLSESLRHRRNGSAAGPPHDHPDCPQHR